MNKNKFHILSLIIGMFENDLIKENGGKKLKTLLNKLKNIELNNHVNEFNKESKTFINGFGESIKREITCNKYEKTQKSMEKEILNFIN